MFSPSDFYSVIRKQFGALKPSQVEGLDLILREAVKRRSPLNHLAYIFATTWWESGKTMQPVREAFYIGSFDKAEAWRKKNLRYYPFYGRGYVQLTWDFNYKKVTEYFNKVLGIKVDFVKNPDLVMKPEYAVIILFVGMEEGWFTTKKLSDYIDDRDESDSEDMREFKEARRIINGVDKAEDIARIALVFERALKAGNWSSISSVPPPVPPKPEPAAPRGLLAMIIELLLALFGKKGK